MLVKCSIYSIKRFIKFYLSIKPSSCWFHQTLTFKEKIDDELAAKGRLKAMLDSLEKAYPQIASFFIQGLHKEHGIHFHIIFVYYGKVMEPPERMAKMLGKEVFKRWNKINGLTLSREANRMILQEKNLKCIDYLLSNHFYPVAKNKRGKSVWHGIRNRKIFNQNSIPVVWGSVNQTYDQIFPTIKRVGAGIQGKDIKIIEKVPKAYTWQQLKSEKDYISYNSEFGSGGLDWEGFKKRELKTNGKVSDNAYLKFRNKERDEILEKYEPVFDLLA